jgi:hypothetical protein
MKVGPGCTVGLQIHVTLTHTEGMVDIKVNNCDKWPTQDYRHPLNKSMRHMEDSDSIDVKMKICAARGINPSLHRDWKNNQSEE